jgi:hypothetical protein
MQSHHHMAAPAALSRTLARASLLSSICGGSPVGGCRAAWLRGCHDSTRSSEWHHAIDSRGAAAANRQFASRCRALLRWS